MASVLENSRTREWIMQERKWRVKLEVFDAPDDIEDQIVSRIGISPATTGHSMEHDAPYVIGWVTLTETEAHRMRSLVSFLLTELGLRYTGSVYLSKENWLR